MSDRTIISTADSLTEVQGALHFMSSALRVELDEEARLGAQTLMGMMGQRLGQDVGRLVGMVTQPGNMPS